MLSRNTTKQPGKIRSGANHFASGLNEALALPGVFLFYRIITSFKDSSGDLGGAFFKIACGLVASCCIIGAAVGGGTAFGLTLAGFGTTASVIGGIVALGVVFRSTFHLGGLDQKNPAGQTLTPQTSGILHKLGMTAGFSFLAAATACAGSGAYTLIKGNTAETTDDRSAALSVDRGTLGLAFSVVQRTQAVQLATSRSAYTPKA